MKIIPSFDRPVILCCPVRNEKENLKRMLPTWQTFADYIVVADQESTDGTKELLSQVENVFVVTNTGEGFDETHRIALLVNKARELSSEAILLFLDADETLSANIVNSPEWTTFCESELGTASSFSKITLWKSPFQYIGVGQSSPERQNLAFIDDGRPLGRTSVMHGPRGVGLDAPQFLFCFNEVVCLHYAWVHYQRAARRQHWYKAWWVLKGSKYYHANRNHDWYTRVTANDLRESPVEWFAGYLNARLDVTSFVVPDLMWFDVQMLQWFKEHGIKKFYLANIWQDTDWEALRQRAIDASCSGISTEPIIPPNKFIIAYQQICNRDLTVITALQKFFRRFWRLVLP